MCLTTNSNEEDGEVDHIRARLSKVLKKQEPIDDYFSRLSVDPRAHGMLASPSQLVLSLHIAISEEAPPLGNLAMLVPEQWLLSCSKTFIPIFRRLIASMSTISKTHTQR